MPSVAQGFKKPVSSFNGEFTAVAHCTKEGIVICKEIQTAFKAYAEKQDWPFESFVLSLAIRLDLLKFIRLSILNEELLDRKPRMLSSCKFSSLPHPFKWAMLPPSWCFISLRSTAGRSGGNALFESTHMNSTWSLCSLQLCFETTPQLFTLQTFSQSNEL